jgi:hypothetical protein
MAKKGYKSRHGKKNQRKHTDIADLEGYIEEKQQEELLQGGIPEEKPDEQLFFVDKIASEPAGKGFLTLQTPVFSRSGVCK